MPRQVDKKWTREEADGYLCERTNKHQAVYFASLTAASPFGPSRGFGQGDIDKGKPELAYQTRAAKTQTKLAQADQPGGRLSKKGALETKDQLIKRKIEKDLKRAEDVNQELSELGRYIESKCWSSTFIKGPIKKFDSALRKTTSDNEGRWTDNKDLARCTIAIDSTSGVAYIAATVMNTCRPSYGMQLIKAKERKPIPTDDNPCGYSDWNFVVIFKGSKIPAEIQVNSFAMMYGKMSKEDYTNAILGKDIAKYTQEELQLQFPGGLGHLFYEIVRDKQSTAAEQKAAAEMGIWYNNLCRMGAAERAAEAKNCCPKYQEFCNSLTSDFAKKVVKDHPLDARWGVTV